jgi:hypothetical protein
MPLLQPHDTGDMVMKRSDFLKICFAALVSALALKWLKIFDQADHHGLKEARFYRSCDTLPG